MLSLIHLIHSCTHLSLFQVIFTYVLGSYSSTSIIMALWYFLQVRSAHLIPLCSLSLYFTLDCAPSDIFPPVFLKELENHFAKFHKNSILRLWDDWYQSVNLGGITCLQEPFPGRHCGPWCPEHQQRVELGWPAVTFGCCVLVISTKNKHGAEVGGAWNQDGTHQAWNLLNLSLLKLSGPRFLRSEVSLVAFSWLTVPDLPLCEFP